MIDPIIGASSSHGVVRVRTSTTGYFASAFLIMFSAALVARFYAEFPAIPVAAVLLLAAGIVYAFEFVAADARTISRRGPLTWLLGFITGRRRLKLAHVEQIETSSIQRFRIGARVNYSYLTTISGRGETFTVRSGRRGYGKFIIRVLSRVPEDVLDNRSIELREYFAARKDVRSRAAKNDLPDGDVLEASLKRARGKRDRGNYPVCSPDPEKAADLRRLGNELRIAGFLLQALEAFRRAVVLQPMNAWLLFDFGRCLLSCAVSEKDTTLERRAFALMRLAEKRAGRDTVLLAQLGESYFHAGKWNRAAIVFKRAVDEFGANFRVLRGQAEIALREGKFAHVIHNFSHANALTPYRALKRWTNNEIEYFTRLNSDEEYMELEISRLSLIDKLMRLGRSTRRIAFVGVAIVLVGELAEDRLVADMGWAISSIALLLWIIATVLTRILAPRIPPDSLDEE